MHFHQNRLGTPAILRQDISGPLENLLLETLNVDFDEIYSLAGEGVVERYHRHRDDAVGYLWTRFDSRLQSTCSGKADFPVALSDRGSDCGYSVLPAVDTDVGF